MICLWHFGILINQGMSNIMEFKRLKYKYPENISTLNPLTIKLMERSLFMHADYWLAQGWWLWIQWMCSNPLSFQVVKGRTNWWKSRLISMWHLLGGGTKNFYLRSTGDCCGVFPLLSRIFQIAILLIWASILHS